MSVDPAYVLGAVILVVLAGLLVIAWSWQRVFSVSWRRLSQSPSARRSRSRTTRRGGSTTKQPIRVIGPHEFVAGEIHCRRCFCTCSAAVLDRVKQPRIGGGTWCAHPDCIKE